MALPVTLSGTRPPRNNPSAGYAQPSNWGPFKSNIAYRCWGTKAAPTDSSNRHIASVQINVGNNSTNEKYAEKFTSTGTDEITGVWAIVGTSGATPMGDSLRMALYSDSSGSPGSLLASGTVDGDDIDSGYTQVYFEFSSSYTLTNSTDYWVVMERTGSLDGSKYYTTTRTRTLDASGHQKVLSSSSWTTYSYGLPFSLTSTDEAFYVVALDYSDQTIVEVWKATDPTSSFSEVDSSNHPDFIASIRGYDCVWMGSGIIHIAIQEGLDPINGPGDVYYYTFDTVDDTWDTTGGTNLPEGLVYAVSSSQSNGCRVTCGVTRRETLFLFYQGDDFAYHGGDYGRPEHARWTSTTWTTAIQVESDSNGVDYWHNTAVVKDGYHTVDVLYWNDTSELGCTATFTNGGRQNEAAFNHEYPRTDMTPWGRPVYDPANSVARAPILSDATSSGIEDVRLASGAEGTTPAWGDGSTDHSDAETKLGASLVMVLDSDAGDRYTFWVRDSNSDLYYFKNQETTNTLVWAGTFDAFSCNYYTRGGSPVIAFAIWNGTALVYDELSLAVATEAAYPPFPRRQLTTVRM